MGNSNEFKDVFLERMFKTSSLDKPSDDFTEHLMKRIQLDVALKTEADKPIIELKYWLMIGLGLLVAAYVLFQMDWSFVQVLFAKLNIQPIEWPALPELPKLSFDFLENFQKAVSSIYISPILIIALVAIGSLITIDRILKNRTNASLFMF